MNKARLAKLLIRNGFTYERGGYWFKDNNSKTLTVAHIDHIGKDRPVFKSNGDFVNCISLDDRLGIYCMLDIYPKIGIKTDLLITDFEEIGNTTATYFDSTKDYNWIVELDRRLDGFVTYNDYTEYNDTLIYNFGTHHYGSFSDISMLPQSRDTLSFNLGIGYNKEHTTNCYANLRHTLTAMYNLLRFWRKYKDAAMHVEYIPITKRSYYNKWDKNYIEEVEYKPIINKNDIHKNNPEKWYLRCDYCESEDNDLAYSPIYDVWLCKDCQELFDDDYIYRKDYSYE